MVGYVWKFNSRGSRKVKKIHFPSGRQAAREKNFFTFLLPSEWNFHTYPPAMHRISFYNVTKSRNWEEFHNINSYHSHGRRILLHKFILFLGWEEFYNINSYFFRVRIDFTEKKILSQKSMKILWHIAYLVTYYRMRIHI